MVNPNFIYLINALLARNPIIVLATCSSLPDAEADMETISISDN
jgi:hypothetical protein